MTLVGQDHDGEYILDYAGPSGRRLYGDRLPSPNPVAGAREFAVNSRAQFQAAGNQKLFERYSQLSGPSTPERVSGVSIREGRASQPGPGPGVKRRAPACQCQRAGQGQGHGARQRMGSRRSRRAHEFARAARGSGAHGPFPTSCPTPWCSLASGVAPCRGRGSRNRRNRWQVRVIGRLLKCRFRNPSPARKDTKLSVFP